MSDDRFLARLRTDPRYALAVPEDDRGASVRVVGYHASFATTPGPGPRSRRSMGSVMSCPSIPGW